MKNNLKYTLPKRVYTAQVDIEEIKSSPQVYTNQEGVEEIKNNPWVSTTQKGLEKIKNNPQVYTTQEGIGNTVLKWPGGPPSLSVSQFL